MHISLNGHAQELQNHSTLQHLIEQFCKSNKHVIAELNGSIIKAKDWESTPIKDGDQLELVSIVGGG